MSVSIEVLCNPNNSMNRSEAMEGFKKNMNALQKVLGRKLVGGRPNPIGPVISDLCDKCSNIPEGRFELVPLMYICENDGSDYVKRAADVSWHLALCGIEVQTTTVFSMYDLDALSKALKGGSFDADVLASALADSTKFNISKFSVSSPGGSTQSSAVSQQPAAATETTPASSSSSASAELSPELIKYLESKGSVEAAVKELIRLQELSPTTVRAESCAKAAMNAYELIK